jgi:hypothetical protein
VTKNTRAYEGTRILEPAPFTRVIVEVLLA